MLCTSCLRAGACCRSEYCPRLLRLWRNHLRSDGVAVGDLACPYPFVFVRIAFVFQVLDTGDGRGILIPVRSYHRWFSLRGYERFDTDGSLGLVNADFKCYMVIDSLFVHGNFMLTPTGGNDHLFIGQYAVLLQCFALVWRQRNEEVPTLGICTLR
jgi:hypothetical protein